MEVKNSENKLYKLEFTVINFVVMCKKEVIGVK